MQVLALRGENKDRLSHGEQTTTHTVRVQGRVSQGVAGMASRQGTVSLE